MSEVVGTYRHQINFQKPLESRTDYGDELITWEAQGASWCNFIFKLSQSDEKEIATRVQAYAHAEIHLRYRSDVTEKWRIEYNGETYGIDAVLPDSHKMHMIIQAFKIEE